MVEEVAREDPDSRSALAAREKNPADWSDLVGRCLDRHREALRAATMEVGVLGPGSLSMGTHCSRHCLFLVTLGFMGHFKCSLRPSRSSSLRCVCVTLACIPR